MNVGHVRLKMSEAPRVINGMKNTSRCDEELDQLSARCIAAADQHGQDDEAGDDVAEKGHGKAPGA
jgi:hypothetical protein